MSFVIENTELLLQMNFINGEWCDARSKSILPVINPATGEVYATVPDSDEVDAKAAVDAAAEAFKTWKKVPAKQRANILKRWNDLILANAQDLGKIISSE